MCAKNATYFQSQVVDEHTTNDAVSQANTCVPAWMRTQEKKQSREQEMHRAKAAEQALKPPGQKEKPLTLMFKKQPTKNY